MLLIFCSLQMVLRRQKSPAVGPSSPRLPVGEDAGPQRGEPARPDRQEKTRSFSQHGRSGSREARLALETRTLLERILKTCGLGPGAAMGCAVSGGAAFLPVAGLFPTVPEPVSSQGKSPLSATTTVSSHGFFRMFDGSPRRDVRLEASRENSGPRASREPRRASRAVGERREERGQPGLHPEVLPAAWRPAERVMAAAATSSLHDLQHRVT
ncbi:serine/threonine-protein phosphatase 2A 55 kDa regulatory subunit B delta isoform [Phacochoerus africanus]|uniref:serine/threonine-protein phosphatase 2A 55 kDa regulatory subunit B delta isoform n=1 Tax=Phacochoerus africanus TaxID=41426 RepID=UPI001FD99E39|nr:serine/threonine-protein phosphatase 2A 55 kDa regulatory subunit B delta isoform [Phacochoerus africanus]